MSLKDTVLFFTIYIAGLHESPAHVTMHILIHFSPFDMLKLLIKLLKYFNDDKKPAPEYTYPSNLN